MTLCFDNGTSLPGNGFAVDETGERTFLDFETKICTVHAKILI